MKARVRVLLKPEVLDPQGQAIARACRSLGYDAVRDVRQGKIFELELELERADRTRADALLREVAQKLLANPVIEDFQIEGIEANEDPDGPKR